MAASPPMDRAKERTRSLVSSATAFVSQKAPKYSTAASLPMDSAKVRIVSLVSSAAAFVSRIARKYSTVAGLSMDRKNSTALRTLSFVSSVTAFVPQIAQKYHSAVWASTDRAKARTRSSVSSATARVSSMAREVIPGGRAADGRGELRDLAEPLRPPVHRWESLANLGDDEAQLLRAAARLRERAEGLLLDGA